MTIIATVENDTIKLPADVHLPDGTEVTIQPTVSELPAATGRRRTFAERYAKYDGIADALPEDFARNHDHYLHGASKRE